MQDFRFPGVGEGVLLLSLLLLVLAPFFEGLGLPSVLAAVTVPCLLVLRAQRRAKGSLLGGLMVLWLLLVGSLVSLWSSKGPSDDPGWRLVILFGGFYFLPLVLSSVLFALLGRERPER